MNKKKKIIVGLSGGIDSSMSLVLLKKQDWDPIGVSLQMSVWQGKKDFSSAKKVCRKLKIPHYIINVEKDFKKKVVDYFVKEYEKAQTPNPCVICNRMIKFKTLFDFAKKKKIKYIATGHYAKIQAKGKTQEYQLLKARDKTKDQTYNLCFLKKEWLPYIIFPLSGYTKKQIYKLAKGKGFEFLTKIKSSQDFCYLAHSSTAKFLRKKLKTMPGNIINEKKEILGKHQGLHFYTIGQRKGIKIPSGPWFVKDFEVKNNALIITKNQKQIEKKEVILSPFNFVSIKPPKKPVKVMAKVRYRQPLSKAILYPPASVKQNYLKLIFEKPQRAVTPGQYAVFYNQNVCLGGGRIKV